MSKEKMTIQEEEKFKDDMMKQAEDMIKKGEVTQLKEGEWQETPLDNPDILINQAKEDGYKIREGVNPKTFHYELLPPMDPRVRIPVPVFKDEQLKEYGIEDRKELVEGLFQLMHKYGGIGLSAIQVGLPFNMFVAGDHQSIEKGLKIAMFNPVIISSSDEEVMMKEGCLTFPFLFVNIKRPRKCVMKYEDSEGKLQEAHLDGMMSRICQHEYDHVLGRNFVEHVSQFKLKRAQEKAKKLIKQLEKQGTIKNNEK